MLLFQGQQAISMLADPLGSAEVSGAVNYGLITATGIAFVQAIAVVVGHVPAVISAHDRSVALFPDPKPSSDNSRSWPSWSATQ